MRVATAIRASHREGVNSWCSSHARGREGDVAAETAHPRGIYGLQPFRRGRAQEETAAVTQKELELMPTDELERVVQEAREKCLREEYTEEESAAMTAEAEREISQESAGCQR